MFKNNSYILFPSDHALELNHENAQEIVGKGNFELFVPDGTWQQAQRMVKREQIFKDLPHIIINTKRKSTYQLRKQTLEGRLCTLEAVIEFLKLFDDCRVTDSLEWVLERHIVANLQRRGMIKKEEYLKRIELADKLLG